MLDMFWREGESERVRKLSLSKAVEDTLAFLITHRFSLKKLQKMNILKGEI